MKKKLNNDGLQFYNYRKKKPRTITLILKVLTDKKKRRQHVI
jgi:hypothetical protein